MRGGGAGGSGMLYGRVLSLQSDRESVRLRVLRWSGVWDRWRPLSRKRHGGVLADFPTVREGTSGSLLGDLANRAGGAGGATGGALTGGVTFEVDVGAGLMDAGAAL